MNIDRLLEFLESEEGKEALQNFSGDMTRLLKHTSPEEFNKGSVLLAALKSLDKSQ